MLAKIQGWGEEKGQGYNRLEKRKLRFALITSGTTQEVLNLRQRRPGLEDVEWERSDKRNNSPEHKMCVLGGGGVWDYNV